MRIAVFGASGMLGSMLVDYLGQHYGVTAITRRELDVEIFTPQELKDTVQFHDWIINAAGAIPQRCKCRNTFYAVNSNFPLALSYLGNPVIQIATDCVYSGKAGPYIESQKHDETSDYGQSKHLGETVAPNFYNLRCSIIGLEPNGNYSLLKWFLSRSKSAEINGYTNHLWNGITTLHFAKICEAIIKSGIRLPNVQHIVPFDGMSKYEMLVYFGKYFGREDIRVNPVEAPARIDRRLATNNPTLNNKLWKLAGYQEPPCIEGMIQELAEYVK